MNKSTIIFDSFKRKDSNDLEANTSGATLPIINVEENLNVSIKENPDEPVEENLNISNEVNSLPLTLSLGSVLGSVLVAN